MIIPIKYPLLWLATLLALVTSHINSLAQFPESLEGKIDMLTGSVAENDITRDYFINLGPDVVPIVTQKLLNSLAEGASEEGVRAAAIMEMPKEDQKRVRYQTGLIAMQGYALRNMPLSPEVRITATESLYDALGSPYMHARRYALTIFENIDGPVDTGKILALLDDPNKYVRVRAAVVLSKIGDASIADEIEAILGNRKRSLTEEEITKDASFRHGYAAIEKLREKSSPAPSSAVPSTPVLASTEPQPQTEPVAPEEQSESPTDIPILPIAIIAAIIVVAVFFLRRKG